PHQDADRTGERAPLRFVQLDPAVLGDRGAEQRRAIPEVVPAFLVDAAQAAGLRLGERERFVDQDRATGPGPVRVEARAEAHRDEPRTCFDDLSRDVHCLCLLEWVLLSHAYQPTGWLASGSSGIVGESQE